MTKKNKSSKLVDIVKSISKKFIKDNATKEREKSYNIRKIFEQMELDLISSMHRAFYFHQNEQIKEGFEWEQWQLSKLRAMEQYRRRNKKIVGKYNKPIQEAIDRELRGNFSKGESRVERFIDKVKKLLKWRKKENPSIEFSQDIDTSTLKGYIAKELGYQGAVPQEKNFFGVNDKKLEALISTVNNDLNKAQYSVLRKMDDVYRQTIFKSHIYLQNGVKTLNQAIDMATKDFLDKGINSIEYKNGTRVNIASYAEMCLRTANHRAMLLGEGKKRDEYGIHLVVVSAHGNTCIKCEPWQGQILIDDIFSHPSKEYIEQYKVKYKLLSEAIDKGLLHPNCRHALITYFEGITTLPVVPDGKEAIRIYEAEQRQRALERQIRKWKRIKVGSLDPLEEGRAVKKVKELQNTLIDHINENPQLRRAYEREENKIPIENNGDNGLGNGNKYLEIPEKTLIHANEGEFSNPKNPKKIKPGEIRLKSGGHGDTNISMLEDKKIEYNIVKEYSSGVRIGNVPNHAVKVKREGTKQAWFPRSWSDKDIETAAKYVANLKDSSKYLLQYNKDKDGDIISIFKYANYNGVTVAVCYDCKRKQITTIFPDETQRMLGGE